MKLPSEVTQSIRQESQIPQFEMNLLIREHSEDGETFFVAQCIELPGCVSQGDTEEEARKNIEDALQLCLSVLLEDSIKLAKSQSVFPDLRGITSHARINVTANPQLKICWPMAKSMSRDSKVLDGAFGVIPHIS